MTGKPDWSDLTRGEQASVLVDACLLALAAVFLATAIVAGPVA